jgi:hypothetical protein
MPVIVLLRSKLLRGFLKTGAGAKMSTAGFE